MAVSCRLIAFLTSATNGGVKLPLIYPTRELAEIVRMKMIIPDSDVIGEVVSGIGSGAGQFTAHASPRFMDQIELIRAHRASNQIKSAADLLGYVAAVCQ